MTKLTNEEIQQLRDISIYTILGLKENGRRVSISCPFPNHSDGTPSFTLYPQNSYHCFGCKETGQGAIDFVMALGATFTEACEELKNYV